MNVKPNSSAAPSHALRRKNSRSEPMLECVDTQESMMQAMRLTRRGGYVSYVGVPHGVELNGQSSSSPTSTCTGGPRRCDVSCGPNFGVLDAGDVHVTLYINPPQAWEIPAPKFRTPLKRCRSSRRA